MAKNIPSLSFDIWSMIARRSFITRRSLRLVSKDLSNLPLRFRFAAQCSLCKCEPFIPVKLRFDWKIGGYRAGAGNSFCPTGSIFCLRCARAWVEVGISVRNLRCPNGCCQVKLHNYAPELRRPFTALLEGKSADPHVDDVSLTQFYLIMGYGKYPRNRAELPHADIYRELDEVGVGKVLCPRCNKNCKSIVNAANHIRTECRQTKAEKQNLTMKAYEVRLGLVKSYDISNI